MSVPVLRAQRADAYEQHMEKEGLVIGIHPITQKAEITQNFNINLLDEGLLPILVVAENRNLSSSFIIAKEKVFVLNESTGTTNASRSEQVATGKASAGGVLEIVGAGGLLGLAGVKMASDATVIQFNLGDKEFYSRTLGPGEKAQGFLYFQFPKGSSLAANYHVVAEVKNSTTGGAASFDFPVNLALSK
jgi:hypothetical protein